ncbi:MAG: hypothetical protein ACE5G7_05710 [Candidatus Hydrothermarchaeaceae archaeon]
MEEKPTIPIVLSAISGILILLTGLLLLRMVIGMGDMMGQIMEIDGLDISDWLPIMAGIDLISGALVTFGAIMLNRQPERHKTYGIIILVFSFISILGVVSGFAAILGIVGGIWAIGWKLETKSSP